MSHRSSFWFFFNILNFLCWFNMEESTFQMGIGKNELSVTNQKKRLSLACLLIPINNRNKHEWIMSCLARHSLKMVHLVCVAPDCKKKHSNWLTRDGWTDSRTDRQPDRPTDRWVNCADSLAADVCWLTVAEWRKMTISGRRLCKISHKTFKLANVLCLFYILLYRCR